MVTRVRHRPYPSAPGATGSASALLETSIETHRIEQELACAHYRALERALQILAGSRATNHTGKAKCHPAANFFDSANTTAAANLLSNKGSALRHRS
jgi:hypothetical protein